VTQYTAPKVPKFLELRSQPRSQSSHRLPFLTSLWSLHVHRNGSNEVRKQLINGSKILVVEDHYLLAEVICEFISECCMAPIGPAACLQTALVYAREADLDGAVLDIDLDGRLSTPVCAMLTSRNIPFIFHTGYRDLSFIPSQFQSVATVAKPFEPSEMKSALEKMLCGALADKTSSVATRAQPKITKCLRLY
jgi:CheY-like chemotaxis protein